MQDIAQFEARKFYYEHRQDLKEIEILLQKKEAATDFILSLAWGFFFGSWVITGIHVLGIW